MRNPEIQPLTPEQQENYATRTINDAEMLRRGEAYYNELGSFSVTAAKEAELATQHQPQPEEPDTEAQISSKIENELMSAERLKDIVDSSIYVANPYVEGRESVKHNAINSSVTRTPIFDQMKFFFPSKGIEKPFTDVGVSELVTVAEGSRFKMKNGEPVEAEWPGGLHKGEALYAVQYMTLTAEAEVVPDDSRPSGWIDKQKYEYRENKTAHLQDMSDEEVSRLDDRQKVFRERTLGSRGRLSEFNYTLLLPETLAKELEAAMIADPQLARDLGDVLVLNPKGVRQDTSSIDSLWNTWKPPYEKWRETNGGVDRMAFRTGSDQSVEQATIVEY